MLIDRQVLGENVTEWISANPELEIVDIIQTQSSNAQFHCIALSVFYVER